MVKPVDHELFQCSDSVQESSARRCQTRAKVREIPGRNLSLGADLAAGPSQSVLHTFVERRQRSPIEAFPGPAHLRLHIAQIARPHRLVQNGMGIAVPIESRQRYIRQAVDGDPFAAPQVENLAVGPGRIQSFDPGIYDILT